jgi:hypothetical protein
MRSAGERSRRGALAEALDDFQRDVAEQIGWQAKTAQALEFGEGAPQVVRRELRVLAVALTGAGRDAWAFRRVA